MVRPRSRRSSVFRVPVEVSPRCTQRERRSAIERAPNTVGSTYGGALWRFILLGARGIICAVSRSEYKTAQHKIIVLEHKLRQARCLPAIAME